VNDLPKWAWDLLMDLVEQEDIHPTLLFESGAFAGTKKYDWCACTALEKVPSEVRGQAKVLLRYRQMSEAVADD